MFSNDIHDFEKEVKILDDSKRFIELARGIISPLVKSLNDPNN